MNKRLLANMDDICGLLVGIYCAKNLTNNQCGSIKLSFLILRPLRVCGNVATKQASE